MSQSVSPYIVGMPVPSDHFVGRSDIVGQIFASLNSPYTMSVSVVGDVGIGKTSLLGYIADPKVIAKRLLDPEGYVFVQLAMNEFRPFSSEAQLLGVLAQKISAQTGLVAPSMATRDDLSDLLELVRQKRQKTVLVIDDLDSLFTNQLLFDVGDFCDFLRSLFIRHLIVLVTSSVRPLNELDVNRIASPFTNIFMTIRLGLFGADEAHHLIEQSALKSDYSLVPYTAFLLDLAGRHPYYLQLACQITFDMLSQVQVLSEEDLDYIRSHFHILIQETFDCTLKRFPEWRKALAATCIEGPLNEHRIAIQEMIDYGYLLGGEKPYLFFSTAFRDYVIQWVQGKGLGELLARIEQELLCSGRVDHQTAIHSDESLRRRAIEEFYDSHSGWNLLYEPETVTLRVQDGQRLQDTMGYWLRLKRLSSGKEFQDIDVIYKTALNLFNTALCLSASCFSSDPNSSPLYERNLMLLMLDTFSAFEGTRLPIPLPVLILTKPTLEEDDLDMVRRSIPMSFRVALLLLFAEAPEIEKAQKLLDDRIREAYAIDVIVLTQQNLATFAIAKDAHQELRRVLLSKIDLRSVSPYTIGGRTPDHIFVGREQELRELTERLQTTSVIVYGGRQFGKTSILGRLNTRLAQDGFEPVYFDCSSTEDIGSFITTVSKRCLPSLPPLNSLTRIAESLPRERLFVFLLDEVDKLIALDRRNGYLFFNEVQMLVQSERNHCRFVLCGERLLFEACVDADGPFHSWTNITEVGPLTLGAAQELIVKPLKQLEFRLIHPDVIVKQIYTFTAGHPNVIQRLCDRLIRDLSEMKERQLTLTHVNKVLSSTEFQQRDFFEIYWILATTLEKLISLIMAKYSQVHSALDIQSALKQEDVEVDLVQIDRALKRLIHLRKILNTCPNGYEFAVTTFPKILSTSVWLEEWIAVNREIWHVQGDVVASTQSQIPEGW